MPKVKKQFASYGFLQIFFPPAEKLLFQKQV